jgi:hypothetical protein
MCSVCVLCKNSTFPQIFLQCVQEREVLGVVKVVKSLQPEPQLVLTLHDLTSSDGNANTSRAKVQVVTCQRWHC